MIHITDHPWLQNANKAPNVNLGETIRARLQQFSVMNKFKKKALRVIAEHLSVEEIADIKEMFENMDINKKGQINFDELKYGLRKLGHQVADSDVKALLEAATTQSDKEFIQSMLYQYGLAFDDIPTNGA
ncbi:hypothetical protein ZIOFF_063791 [Zingiber officinale]|uniref:EF-hand domain-containing protein n=1 Tax=Zingiber officinale TaxID=94328 RepID=A0A8J5KBF3_ZINOF|nr:hypothetical protein ZIOFF_063791 [Zingiber officinale]